MGIPLSFNIYNLYIESFDDYNVKNMTKKQKRHYTLLISESQYEQIYKIFDGQRRAREYAFI